MFSIKLYSKILIIITLVSLSGCKTAFESEKNITDKLPKRFLNEGTSEKLSLPNRSNFFIDSTLTGLINTSLQQNFDVQLAMQRVQQYRSEVILTKGIRLPDLNLNASAGQQRFGKYTADGVGNYDTNFSQNITQNQTMSNPLPDYYVGLHSQWELDLWGKLNNKKKAAYARFLASENGKNLVITNMIAEVAGLYYELLALDAEKKILVENIELQESSLEIVTIQKQVGRANELGIEIMQGRLLNSKGKLIEVEQKIIINENQINFLLGRYPQPIKRPESILNLPLPQKIAEGVPSDMLGKRPDIVQAEFELTATKSDVKSAQAAFYPSLIINGSVGFHAFDAALLLESPSSLAYNIIGGLTAPLLNRRVLKAQLLSAKTSQKQAYINYHKTIVNGFKEVYNSITQLNNAQKMTELKTQEVKTFKNSIATSGELFKTGKANYLEIVNTQKNYLDSQLELVNLKKIQLQSTVNLYRSLGGGLQ